MADSASPLQPLTSVPVISLDPQDRSQCPALPPDRARSTSDDVFQLGDFLIGDGDCSSLGGHPDIRY
ncbi:MAG: hypothetical protein H7Z21_18895 [Hymenobacter sp.]|nr:hypothetical protein [Hymenobacter sp.]